MKKFLILFLMLAPMSLLAQKFGYVNSAEIIQVMPEYAKALKDVQALEKMYTDEFNSLRVIWAEIPYISRHMPGGRDNTISQMKELIVQNYNHPCIVVWGLSNEISIAGSDESLLENHRTLNDMVHEMDKTRLTTIAAPRRNAVDHTGLLCGNVFGYLSRS